jgi:UDP-3-O-[3-hydroxymyristoyl] glucosamine N-acyltransferase
MMMTLDELGAKVGVEVVGDGTRTVDGCGTLESASASDVSFLANTKYIQSLATTNAAAVFLRPQDESPQGMIRLETDDPYLAFRDAIVLMKGFRPHPMPHDGSGTGISAAASIDPTATVGDDVTIHAHVTIGPGAVVGQGCVLYSGVVIGEEATLGCACVLYPNVTIYDRCRLGDRVVLHASTSIGQDGFGYATSRGVHHKIPQTGIVVIEDDVEMGAGCAIERATIGETRIGKGTKFADLISIGHGTTVGEHCLFVSLVGVAGSVTIGNHVVLGGQVGVAGHLTIGDGVQAIGKSGISQSVEAGSLIGGTPAIKIETWRRNAITAAGLYELSRRVRRLERQLAASAKESDSP